MKRMFSVLRGLLGGRATAPKVSPAQRPITNVHLLRRIHGKG